VQERYNFASCISFLFQVFNFGSRLHEHPTSCLKCPVPRSALGNEPRQPNATFRFLSATSETIGGRLTLTAIGPEVGAMARVGSKSAPWFDAQQREGTALESRASPQPKAALQQSLGQGTPSTRLPPPHPSY